MMKKKTTTTGLTRLKLNREALLRMDAKALAGVRGGGYVPPTATSVTWRSC